MSAIFNRDQVISNLWRSPDVAAAIAKMEPVELQDDLRQELFLVLCRMDQVKLQGLSERGELRWYVVRIILNMVKSDRSTFYNLHRKFREEVLSGLHYVAPNGEIVNGVSKKIAACGWEFDSDVLHDHRHKYTNPALKDHDEIQKDWEDHVQNAVNELDPYEADMIRLYVDMGYNCAPIAKATGIQVRSVRYVVSQAREKLQKRLRSHAA